MHGLKYMIRSKHSGFTLIEVLLAGALVGIALGPIYLMQGNVYDQVLRMAQRVERFFIGYDFLLEAQSGDEESIKETEDDPRTELSFELMDPPSDIAKQFNHLRMEKAQWRWRLQKRTYQDVFISFVFDMPEQKAEQEVDQKQGAQASMPPGQKSATPSQMKPGEKK